MSLCSMARLSGDREYSDPMRTELISDQELPAGCLFLSSSLLLRDVMMLSFICVSFKEESALVWNSSSLPFLKVEPGCEGSEDSSCSSVLTGGSVKTPEVWVVLAMWS